MGKYAALFAAPPDDSLKIPTYTPPPAPPPIEYGPQPSPEETSNAALARAYPGAATVDDAALLNRIGGKYKALDPYMKNAAIVQRQPIPGDDRQLEFHHPLSSENPVPGKMTFELFRPFKGQEREDAVAADALHYLGGRTQDDSGPPVDPQWSQLRDRLWNARSASQKSIDDKTYRDEHENGQSFDDWASRNRKDAYVRGGMFPEANPEWNRGPGDPYAWTPEQNATFTAMRGYLANGPKQDFKLPTYAPPEDQAGPVSPESQAWAMSPPVQTANAQARLEGGQGTWEDRKLLGKSVPTDQDEGREFAKFAARAAAGELAAPLIGKGVSAIAARVRAIQAARAGAGAMPPIEEAAPPVALNAQGSKGGAVDLASRLAAKQAAEDWAKEQATGQLDYEPAPAQPDGLAEHGLQMHTWQPFKDDEVFSKWKATPEFNGVGLVQKDDPSKFVAIHRSTKEPGRWQASSFDSDGAVGDSIRDNPDELLQDYSHKRYNPVALKTVGAPVDPEEQP
ncbi:MAG TPA: hypothetical protein VHN39_05200 [Phenylobacterium sp.]|nr:hypothetical protein [Phenylobacterium sp.]